MRRVRLPKEVLSQIPALAASVRAKFAESPYALPREQWPTRPDDRYWDQFAANIDHGRHKINIFVVDGRAPRRAAKSGTAGYFQRDGCWTTDGQKHKYGTIAVYPFALATEERLERVLCHELAHAFDSRKFTRLRVKHKRRDYHFLRHEVRAQTTVLLEFDLPLAAGSEGIRDDLEKWLSGEKKLFPKYVNRLGFGFYRVWAKHNTLGRQLRKLVTNKLRCK